MDWPEDARDWPHAETARIVTCRPHRWYVQSAGEGDDLLLLHGTGASCHSWAGIHDLLARHYRVVAVDLPGHGFTRMGTRQRSRPATIASDLWSLLAAEGIAPRAIVGHSAGAALALQMATAQERRCDVAHVVGLNAALSGFEGAAGWLFPMAARAMAAMPGLTAAMSRIARSEGRVARLLANTGSTLDAADVARYRRLLSDPRHIEGALCMMAQWSTKGFDDVVERFDGRLTLMTGERDRTIAPDVSIRAAGRARDGTHVSLGPVGHLAHEEAPERTAGAILSALGPIAR